MKILVFEWCVGGGLADEHPLDSANASLLEQGRHMLIAVCEDFHNAGHQVSLPVDVQINFEISFACEKIPVSHSESLPTILAEMATAADFLLLIAPECDSIYINVCQWLHEFRHKFLGPDLEFVRLTGDKWACHQYLCAANIATPKTMLVPADQAIAFDELNRHGIKFPIVSKPVDGAGSEGVCYVPAKTDYLADYSVGALASDSPSCPEPFLLIQSFVSGTPVSVSAVVSVDRPAIILPPTGQCFDADPIGNYIGALHPLPVDVAVRATALAKCALDMLPPTRGYIGIDMIISNSNKSEDVVIEINPRLTLSYVSLRGIVSENLAAAMIAAAATDL